MNFLKYKFIYFTISGLLVIVSVGALVGWGLKPAIDFTGGSLWELQFEKGADLEKIRSVLTEKSDIMIAGLQTAGFGRVIIKSEPVSQALVNETVGKLKDDLGGKVSLWRFESIGPTLGKELLSKMLLAVFLTAGFILFYIAWTFKNIQYGVSAILAMFHDTLILLGSFSLLGHFYGVEVDTLFITAVLTTLSFSVHDTVVVYDRIRESEKYYPKATMSELANKSLTETMNRSLNNSVTIILMLSALWLLGGSAIQWFVVALLIGTVTGTYSSPFVAVPILVVLKNLKFKVQNSKL